MFIYGHDGRFSNILEETGRIIFEEQQIYLQKGRKEHSLRLYRITVRSNGIIKPNQSTHALNEDSHHLRSKRKKNRK